MSVINTKKWLDQESYNPIKLCKKLEPYFNKLDAQNIYHYLTLNGMFRKSKAVESNFIKDPNKIYNIIKQEHQNLRKEWHGPDIPIIILPSDPMNQKLIKEFNGKSGLAFKDKLFLFLSKKNTTDEIRALFVHEYNHVCRLKHYKKKEETFTLLDTVILEGLAEHAVLERFGKEYLASWTSYYDSSIQQKLWKRFVQPNKDISVQNPKHNHILYGLKLYPKMTGYSVGYYLVNNYIQKHNTAIKDMLSMDSTRIASIST